MKRIILSLSIALAGVLNMQAEKKDFPVDFSIDGFDYQIVKDYGGNLLSVWVADDEEPFKTGTVTIPTSFHTMVRTVWSRQSTIIGPRKTESPN